MCFNTGCMSGKSMAVATNLCTTSNMYCGLGMRLSTNKVFTLLFIGFLVLVSVFLHFAPGTGNVLKIQSLLHICSEFYSTEKKEEEGEAEVGGKKVEGEEGGKETPMDEGSDTGMQR